MSVPHPAFGRSCRACGVGMDEAEAAFVGGIIRGRSENAAEIVIELIDESPLRTEVGGEGERRDRKLAEETGFKRLYKPLDTRLTEEVDGLIRVADEEYSLRVTVPGRGEMLQQFILTG